MSNSTDEALYDAVKARIVACDFPQGQRIPLTELAAEYDASTLAVRRVLERLASDGLVTKAEGNGFVAPAFEADSIEGLYLVSRHVVGIALDRLRTRSTLPPSAKESIQRLMELVHQCGRDDYVALADYTAILFAAIADFTESPPLINATARSNEDLHFVRLVECQRVDQATEELERLCKLLLDEKWDELVVAMDEYHRRRTDIVPVLIKAASQ